MDKNEIECIKWGRLVVVLAIVVIVAAALYYFCSLRGREHGVPAYNDKVDYFRRHPARKTLERGERVGVVSDPSGQDLFQLTLEAAERTDEWYCIPVLARLVPSEGCKLIFLGATDPKSDAEEKFYFATFECGGKRMFSTFTRTMVVEAEALNPVGGSTVYARIVALETPLPPD